MSADILVRSLSEEGHWRTGKAEPFRTSDGRAASMIEDLSNHHSPITSLFNWPSRAEDWNQYRLTDDQVNFFHTRGYLAGIRAH